VVLGTARGRGQALDRRWYARLNDPGGGLGDRTSKAITELGSIWASVGIAIALSRTRRRREAMDALGAALAMWSIGQVAKRIVRRPRPYRALGGFRLLIREPNGTSWPSSHPAVLLAFLIVACRDLGVPRPARLAAAALAGAVGWSRVRLGVHYPADVAGGLLLGRCVADLWSERVSPSLLGWPPATVSPVQ
jgi:membrane-associated phospholipid phosphatase